ncbi:MAG: bifunctional 4-hydroxy-2-oxoglutarate aldolase/2-dehydro-3-deoxy-phosphogluconate aldolase [Williamsia sp.]|nr:bifunctional 4-hydroxy-2-oxoglutarate aldolase/2-dehydro-3-deoxy-phosphogluconate aldolase [Williamsia sp.]
MNKQQHILDLIRQQGVLPLYYHADPVLSSEILKALYAGGIKTVEYTNRGEHALENFKQLLALRDREMPELMLGIGTVKNVTDARAYLAAGADYIIAPGMIKEVAEVVHAASVLWIPGCMTPSEIMQAEQFGAKLVKLFPGNLLGPQFMSAIKELFPNLLFMPTGGVEPEATNIRTWFDAGVCAVGMGSKLITKKLFENRDFTGLRSATESLLDIIKSIKSK